MNCYSVVIFKNKIKRKILKNYKSFENASNFFESFLEKNKNILFEKQYENGLKCYHELAIVGPYDKNMFFYIKDNLGKNIKIQSNTQEFSIYKLSNLKIEEELFDILKKNKVSVKTFLKKYVNSSGMKMFSKINNKLVFQKDDIIELFSLKNLEDCERFFDFLGDYIVENNLQNCLIIKDYNITQKKYLYKVLEERGISKKVLYRQSTTHLK